MKSLDRLQAMVAGETVDRPPFSLYQNWPLVFMTGESLATVCYAFAEHMQLDVAVVPHCFGYPMKTNHSFDRPVDLSEIEKVHGNSDGWGRQLHALQRVVKASFGKRWVLQEVPSPWLLLQQLAGPELITRTKGEYSGFLRRALETVSESLASFVRYAVDCGAQGILYRSSGASFEEMTVKEYALWGEPFDAKVWTGLRDSTFNVVQYVGSKPHLRDLNTLPLPSPAISWSVVHGPRLETPTNRWAGPVYGGLDETRLDTSLNSLRAHVEEVLRDGPATKWILASGEPLPAQLSLGKLEALRDVVLNYKIPKPRPPEGEGPLDSRGRPLEERGRRKPREDFERPAPPLRNAPQPVAGARSRIVGGVPVKAPVPPQEFVPQPEFVTPEVPVTQQEPVSEREPLTQHESTFQQELVPQQEPISQHEFVPQQELVSEQEFVPQQEPLSQREAVSQQEPLSQREFIPQQQVPQHELAPQQAPLPLHDFVPQHEQVSQEDFVPQHNPLPQRKFVLRQDPVSQAEPVLRQDPLLQPDPALPPDPASGQNPASQEPAPRPESVPHFETVHHQESIPRFETVLPLDRSEQAPPAAGE